MESRSRLKKSTTMNLDAQDVEAVIAHGSHEQLTACLRVLLENRDTTINDNRDLNDQLSEYQLELDTKNQALHECQMQLNDALADQAAIEEDALSRQVQMEVLASKLQASERKEHDLQRSNQVQLDKFDKDRKSWFELESGLRAKVTTLSAKIVAQNRSARGEATPPSSPSPSSPNSAPIMKSMSIESASERTAREAALEKAQQSLDMEKQRRSVVERNERTLKIELDQSKRVVEELRSENESYMLLLQERTFSGDLLGSSVFDSMRDLDDSGIAAIAEEPEDNSMNVSDDEENEDFTPKRRRARRRGPGDARKKSQPTESPKPLSEENGGNIGVTGPGYDLAAELGRAKLDTSDREETLDSLKNDNKTLKEANKALTTYVSKIIEKIINQEGFEHILASDYRDPEQRESLRLKRSQTTSSSAGRSSLGGVSDALLNSRKKPADMNTSTVRTRPTHKGGSEKRRSLSIDWSNIGGFFKGNAAQMENTAQKLPKQEEDEEDRKERDKLRAEMKKISSESLNSDGQFTRFDNQGPADIKRRAGSVGTGALANWRKKRAERAEQLSRSSGNALSDVTNATTMILRSASRWINATQRSTRRTINTSAVLRNPSQDEELQKLYRDIDAHYNTSTDLSNVIHPGLWESEERIETNSPAYKFGKYGSGQIVIPETVDSSMADRLANTDKAQLRQQARSIYKLLEVKKNVSPKKTPRFIAYNRPDQALAYALAIGPGVYAAVYSVMREVRRRASSEIDGWLPHRVIELGSGAGVSAWATMDAFKYGGNSHSIATEEYEDSDETAIVNDGDKEESTLHPVQQYDAFDPSEDMNEFNRQLWKDAQRKAQLNVTRKFISSRFKSEDPVESSKTLAMSTFTLSELGNAADRRDLIQRLWKSNAEMMVIIDRGTRSGYERVMEARQQLLDLGGTSESSSHVLAPCPHDGTCPLLNTKDFCHFSQRLQRPAYQRFIKKAKLGTEDQKYSYVVIRRGQRPSSESSAALSQLSKYSPTELIKLQKLEAIKNLEVIGEIGNGHESISTAAADESAPKVVDSSLTPVVETTSNAQVNTDVALQEDLTNHPTYDNRDLLLKDSFKWSRVIYQPLKRKGHVIFDTCSQRERIERFIVTKRDGDSAYRDSRKAKWGDLFPHEPTGTVQVKNGGIKRTTPSLPEGVVDESLFKPEHKDAAYMDDHGKVVIDAYDHDHAHNERTHKRRVRGIGSARKLRKGKGARMADLMEKKMVDQKLDSIAREATDEIMRSRYE
ncbi:hypothetical protein E3P99_03693 [Wallemia hederae]|uniref:Rsm22-domain-containing protein n=1 Tax=Wallemia hederae TaxID=1540922 RepID=A0A4T0FDX1_9BASI|nr:hypothetical protein E3P99_03693 [Wallemia hederae]